MATMVVIGFGIRLDKTIRLKVAAA